ncbi:DddA-like double-stranded DNA deaminase toxin [Salinispora arenicola]|uniref:DddA-like double-stranded DNA deaminase toxin n=1 Tax=Salinispora arenicola TaxID=168697 RepID=UPI0003696C0F|nr:DddA-like double-stranded DNA deaminase toxin [Salinispora arenicola]
MSRQELADAANAYIGDQKPAAFDEIRPHVGRDVAVGRLYDTDGRPLTPLVGPGDTGAGTGLAAPLPSFRFIRHVESDATAHMRRHRIRHAVLYTNMRPCLGEDGCTQNVKATLPAGYALTGAYGSGCSMEPGKESPMIQADEHPVQGDTAAVADLHERAHSLDTAALTAHALALGICPPDARPGWLIVLEYDEDGADRGLFWIGPDDQ